MSRIKVIIKRPDEQGHMTWISNTLQYMQRIVEGPIECVTITSDCVVICNEEGRLDRLEPNCRIAGYDFVGTIILAGVNGEEFGDVPVLLNWFKEHMCGPYGGSGHE